MTHRVIPVEFDKFRIAVRGLLDAIDRHKEGSSPFALAEISSLAAIARAEMQRRPQAEALNELIDRIENYQGLIPRALFDDALDRGEGNNFAWEAYKAYSDSDINYALRFADLAAPEWSGNMQCQSDYCPKKGALCSVTLFRFGNLSQKIIAKADNPTWALLLATLYAMRAQMEGLKQ